MAMNPNEVPITREQVVEWYKEWKKVEDFGTWKEFLEDKILDLKLPSDQVNTVGHDDLGDTTSLVDMILADMESYGFEST